MLQDGKFIIFDTYKTPGVNKWCIANKKEDHDWDSDEYPLQIKTNSTNDDDLLSVYLMGNDESADRQSSRFIDIHFSHPMKVSVGYCFVSLDTKENFDDAPPDDKEEMIWTIFKNDAHLLILCEGAPVLTVHFNKTEGYSSDCPIKWPKRVEEIRFSESDTAARKYRRVSTCNYRMDPFKTETPKPTPELKPATVFPIIPGAIVTLYCGHEWFKLTGNDTLTCKEGGTFQDFSTVTCDKG